MKQTDWPVRISVREVRIKDNPGVTDDEYSIFTTATGYGYEKHMYHSNEQMIKAEDGKLKVQNALVDLVRGLMAIKDATIDTETCGEITDLINKIPDDLG